MGVGMRSIRFACAAAFLLAGCATAEEEAGPAGIPYACADGKLARITYEGGGYFPRARASLLFDGRMIELRATPPTFGLRYVSEGEENHGPILVWSARGEEAWLSELADDSTTEREIAHCTRVRSDGEEGAAAAEAPAQPQE
jgi:membrane-bound inhibitor of C-type lysozyme